MKTTTGEPLRCLHPYDVQTKTFGTLRVLFLGRDKSDAFIRVLLLGSGRGSVALPVEEIVAVTEGAPLGPQVIPPAHQEKPRI